MTTFNYNADCKQPDPEIQGGGVVGGPLVFSSNVQESLSRIYNKEIRTPNSATGTISIYGAFIVNASWSGTATHIVSGQSVEKVIYSYSGESTISLSGSAVEKFISSDDVDYGSLSVDISSTEKITYDYDYLVFKICGSTKNIYTVELKNHTITCDCPDYVSGCAKYQVICKHCCFVLFKVLRLLDDISTLCLLHFHLSTLPILYHSAERPLLLLHRPQKNVYSISIEGQPIVQYKNPLHKQLNQRLSFHKSYKFFLRNICSCLKACFK